MALRFQDGYLVESRFTEIDDAKPPAKGGHDEAKHGEQQLLRQAALAELDKRVKELRGMIETPQKNFSGKIGLSLKFHHEEVVESQVWIDDENNGTVLLGDGTVFIETSKEA